jgi:hypothetical protein
MLKLRGQGLRVWMAVESEALGVMRWLRSEHGVRRRRTQGTVLMEC